MNMGKASPSNYFSNLPFEKTGTIPYKNFGSPAVWADIKINKKQMVRVYSIHLHSNHIDPNTIDQVAQGKIQNKETWMDIKGMMASINGLLQFVLNKLQLLPNILLKVPTRLFSGVI